MYLSAYHSFVCEYIHLIHIRLVVTVLPRSATRDNSTSVSTYCGWIVLENYLRGAELSATMRRRVGVGLLLGRHRRRRANII